MKRKPHCNSAFSLVEVTLALGITAFCLVTVFGLLPVGINNNQNSIQQTTATNLVRAVVADLRATQLTSGTSYATSPVFGFQIPYAGQGGTVNGVQTVFFSDSENATGIMGAAPSTNSNSTPGTPTLSTGVSRYRVTVSFTPPSSGSRSASVARILVSWPALADQNPTTWPSYYAGSYEVVTRLDRN